MLTIFTSYTPGAGKSYAMVQKAIEERKKGRNVVVGFLHSGHRDISKILEDNDIQGRDSGKGMSLIEILEKKPDLVVMDEMGMKVKNQGFVYQVIEELLARGIDVYTSSNLKRFESINPSFKRVTGIAIRNTIPDRFLDMAEEIYFIDRAPELMIKDFESGMLFDENYMNSRIMKRNFKKETLESYRGVSIEYLKKMKNSDIRLKIISR
ncbi:MAG: hypothetical protein HFG30_09040 [Eubacterium sp.]|jgi:two-component system sensor histidine kinase KdpD|nr:hypothetical protein [Eubacterium sp.]